MLAASSRIIAALVVLPIRHLMIDEHDLERSHVLKQRGFNFGYGVSSSANNGAAFNTIEKIDVQSSELITWTADRVVAGVPGAYIRLIIKK